MLMDFHLLAPGVQTLDSAIQRINHYPAYNAIVSRNTYLLDSDLTGGQRYPAFEQPGPGLYQNFKKKTVASTLLTCFNAIDFVLLSVYTFEDMIFTCCLKTCHYKIHCATCALTLFPNEWPSLQFTL